MTTISRPNVPPIPENVIVHLGAPDEPAENVTVPFPDYIKNVASSVMYPSWPQSAILANLYAIISFTLNRIYSNWYRDQGYDFDITSTEEFDQTYIPGRTIYNNIGNLVNSNFTSYLVRQGEAMPIYTPFCDGIEKECKGLSQWGAVDLAFKGLTPYDIIREYYGNNIFIVTDIPVNADFESYPLYSFKLGSFGRYVSVLQYELNRIGENYPEIPKISVTDGVFGAETEAAVKAFQRIFNLTEDGVIGPATYYQIKYVYETVKGLSEDIITRFNVEWVEGDTGVFVKLLQYYIRVFGCYYPEIPLIEITGIYGPETTEAIKALQKKYGLPETGKIDLVTWGEFEKDYKKILNNFPEGCIKSKTIYPGYLLKKGMGDQNVLLMQRYLDKISQYYPMIPKVNVNGIFDDQMEAAVKAVQEVFNVGEVTGLIGSPSWNLISEIYESLPE